MKLTREEVLHIALLARLGLTETELDSFREQLSNILNNVGFSVLDINTNSHFTDSKSKCIDNRYTRYVVAKLRLGDIMTFYCRK